MENVAKTPALIGRRGPREYNDAWQEAWEWARRGEGQKEGSEENVKDAEREREGQRKKGGEGMRERVNLVVYIVRLCS